MKKLYTTLLLAILSLNISAQSYNFDAPVRFNSWLTMAKDHPGTHANRLVGVSSAGPGTTGSFMNYVTIGSGLSLTGGILSTTGGGSVDTSNFWNTRGNTITGNKWLGTNTNRSLHIRTNALEYALIDSTGRIRFGASNTLPLFNTTAQSQTHLATAGAYTIRSTTGDIVLNATGSQGVAAGRATAQGYKFNVLGSSFLEGQTTSYNDQGGDKRHVISNENTLFGVPALYAKDISIGQTGYILNGEESIAYLVSDSIAGTSTFGSITSIGFGIGTATPAYGVDIRNKSFNLELPSIGADTTVNVNYFDLGIRHSITSSGGTVTIDYTPDGIANFNVSDKVTFIGSTVKVGIGTSNPAAKLDIVSTTSGVLLPRVTETQRDAFASPANGMIIYNTTTDKFQGYADGIWVDLN